MSCASQKFRVQTKAKTTAMFPAVISSEETSLKFAKSFIGAAVSSICYVRRIFPDDDFDEKKWENENLKIVRGQNPEPREMIKKLKGIFDALEKKYLRQIQFGLYTDVKDPGTVLESYIFNVDYSGGKTTVDLASDANSLKIETEKVYRSVKSFLRQIGFMMSHLDPLPAEKVFWTIKLLYYDERTPADYEPEGFFPSSTDEFRFAKKDVVALGFNKVESKFHSFKVKCKSVCCLEFEQADNDDDDQAKEVSIATDNDQQRLEKRKQPSVGGQVSSKVVPSYVLPKESSLDETISEVAAVKRASLSEVRSNKVVYETPAPKKLKKTKRTPFKEVRDV